MICSLHIFPIQASVSSRESVQIPLTTQTIDKEYKDIPSKGKRNPPVPTYCIIDFSKNLIDTSVNEPIESYEIWDIDGNYIYASFSDEVTFVQYLAEKRGSYQIRLITIDYCYIGYIDI